MDDLTFKAFLNGAGELDGDNVSLALDMLKDHWERISEDCKPHAEHLMQEAEDAIAAAWMAVGKALEENATDKTSDAADFAKQDNRARMANIGRPA